MEAAHDAGSINALIVKPNQIGTVTESIDAVRKAREWGWKVVASHRSGETNDDFIADFAVGVRADGFKLGAPARGERIAKYNRLLEIEKGRQ
jgi:enolase